MKSLIDEIQEKNAQEKIHPVIFKKILEALRLLDIDLAEFEPVIARRGVKKISELLEVDAKKILSGLVAKLNEKKILEPEQQARASKQEPVVASLPEIIAYGRPACSTCRCTWVIESCGLNASLRCWSCRQPINRAITQQDASNGL